MSGVMYYSESHLDTGERGLFRFLLEPAFLMVSRDTITVNGNTDNTDRKSVV